MLSLASCTEPETKVSEMESYEGPLRIADNIEMYYSEETIKKVKLRAAELHEFKSGDREFPKGLYLEFFDEFGKISTTLKANYAYYTSEQDEWLAQGDVVVVSETRNQQLNSEELYWKPSQDKIYTNKFVTIRLGNEVSYGTGFESNQTFTEYEIKNPTGEFEVE